MTPGSGGTFYCQNCLRDSLVVPALSRIGVDVILVPMYLPIATDEAASLSAPVFFGAINVYLQEKLAAFRRTPRWLDRILDGRGLLEFVARKTSSTSARGLEEMTLSMLAGADGRQAKELERLIAWLASEVKPDVVHLSNALLLGLAGVLRERLGCRVVCSLQDEDTWVEAMSGEYPRRVYEAMAQAAEPVDVFVPVSRYYGEKMARLLSIPSDRMEVVPVGIPLEAYPPREAPPETPVVGFLSRMAESLGLGTLVEAFIALKRRAHLRDLRLAVMGGTTRSDRRFLRKLQRRLASEGFHTHAEFIEDFNRESRARFLAGLSVLSVPVPGGEAFGMYILEANACGVPVVQPRVGAFPEIVEATGGGVLYEPGEVGALERALEEVLSEPEKSCALGAQGRQAVVESFGIESIAERLKSLYESLSQGARAGANQA